MSQQQGQLTAAQQVYGIREFLDEILHHLDPTSFLIAYCSARDIHQTVSSNMQLTIKLEQALFQKAAPRHTWLQWPELCRSPLGNPVRFRRISHDPQCHPNAEKNTAQLARLHPCLPHRRSPSHVIGPSHTRCNLDLTRLQAIPEARMNDLLTQPPCTVATFFIYRRSSAGYFNERDGESIVRPEGVRFRDLLEDLANSSEVWEGSVQVKLMHVVEESAPDVQVARRAIQENRVAFGEMPDGDVFG